MSVLYVDTSALLKRVIAEPESAAVRALLVRCDDDGDLITASSLAWLEVWRSLRRAGAADVGRVTGVALSGVAELPLSEEVLARARLVGGDDLRSLDAIHLASALAVGADALLTYDRRLAECVAGAGMRLLQPAG